MIFQSFRSFVHYPLFSIRFFIFEASCPVWPNAPILVGLIFFELIVSQFKCWPTLQLNFYIFLSQLMQVQCFFTIKASSSFVDCR